MAITFEEAAKVHAFLAKKPFDFIHLTNAKKFIDSIALSAYPTTVLLDRKGTIQHVRGGLAYQFDQNRSTKSRRWKRSGCPFSAIGLII